MPKHALDSHPESPKTKKKKHDSDGSTKDSGSKDMEKPKRSVREKLVAGIVIGLTKAQNQQQQQQQQQQAARDSQSFYDVATLQDSLDKKFHVNPLILQNLNSPSQSQNVMIPKEEDDEEEYQRYSSGERGIITDHFRRRSDQRRNTSRRLQAVLGLKNETPFVPPGVSPSLAQNSPGEGLRHFLRSACRTYGYRKLELDLLSIWHIKVCYDLQGELLDSEPIPPPTAGSEFRASLDTKEGSLAIYESDVPDEHGHITTWMWLKICRPLKSDEQSRHFIPPDMSEDPEAWNIIAIPKSQVKVVENPGSKSDAPRETTNGDDDDVEDTEPAEVKKLSVVIRYSRDGVPSMACSDEKGMVLWAWSDFRSDLCEQQWDDIQGDMATRSCLMYASSKLGAGWVTVPPVQPEQPKRSSGGDVRLSSNLKKEVHLEE